MRKKNFFLHFSKIAHFNLLIILFKYFVPSKSENSLVFVKFGSTGALRLSVRVSMSENNSNLLVVVLWFLLDQRQRRFHFQLLADDLPRKC